MSASMVRVTRALWGRGGAVVCGVVGLWAFLAPVPLSSAVQAQAMAVPGVLLKQSQHAQVVHLRWDETTGRGQLVAQWEEWDALLPKAPPGWSHRASSARNPTFIVQYHWIIKNAAGTVTEERWSPDTFRIALDYDVRHRSLAISHAGRSATPVWYPGTRFALPVAQDPFLSADLSRRWGIQTLPNTRVSGEPVRVRRVVSTGPEGALTDTFFISQRTQRLVRFTWTLRRPGQPTQTYDQRVQSYQSVPADRVPARIFTPPLPAGVPVTHE